LIDTRFDNVGLVVQSLSGGEVNTVSTGAGSHRGQRTNDAGDRVRASGVDQVHRRAMAVAIWPSGLGPRRMIFTKGRVLRMTTQPEREAARGRVRRELGVDWIATGPDAPPLMPFPGAQTALESEGTGVRAHYC